MSPAPAKTSYPAILEAAQHLLATQGLENLSMQSLAKTIGVRAPSLYKHVESKSQLVRHVLDSLLAELCEVLTTAAEGQSLAGDLRSMVVAYRAFAHQNPTLYPLLYARLSADMQPDIRAIEAAAVPLLSVMEKWVGAARSLSAARVIVAFAHGFVSMELAGAFHLGGDVDEAFELGIESLSAALNSLSSN